MPAAAFIRADALDATLRFHFSYLLLDGPLRNAYAERKVCDSNCRIILHEFDDFLGTFLGTFSREPCITKLVTVNGGDEHASFSVVGETNIRPVLQSTFYSGPQSFVRQQPFGHVGHEDWVSNIRNAGEDFVKVTHDEGERILIDLA
jgi:hypothetical protein